jgi:hypothetical protein
MIRNHTSYGLLTIPEALVFLKIDHKTDPPTLLYHISEPEAEIEEADDEEEAIQYRSRLSQTLAFALLA